MSTLLNFLYDRLSQLESRQLHIKVFNEHKASFVGKQKAVEKITDLAQIKIDIAETKAAIQAIESWWKKQQEDTTSKKSRKKILTKEQADKVVCREELKALNTGRKDGVQRSSYYCDQCKGWHTTTMIEGCKIQNDHKTL